MKHKTTLKALSAAALSVALLLRPGADANAQDYAGAKSFDGEMRQIQYALAGAGLDDAGKHDALVRLARLQLLSGDVEAATVTWEQAAYARAGRRDDAALLESAACYMAMGEWDKAAANVRLVMLTARDDRRTLLKAKYLNAQIEAFRSGDGLVLNAFLDDADFARERAAIYYILWKTTGNGEYKTRLLIEYPESPETKALLVESGAASGVSIFPGAMWLLPAPVSLARSISAPSGGLETAAPPALQTGLFTGRANAEIQQSRLKARGFDARVSLRQSGGLEYWAVSVPSGGDLNTTVMRLKEAGFEALPVF